MPSGDKLNIISVANNIECFNENIANNNFMNIHKIHLMDNTKDNISITKRYNDFIRDNVFSKKIKNEWLVFCHQDFGFLENPLPKLQEIDKNKIYGVVGVKEKITTQFNLLKLIKNCLIRKKTEIYNLNKIVTSNKNYFKDNKILNLCEGIELSLENDNFYLKATKNLNKDFVSCRKKTVHGKFYQGIHNGEAYKLKSNFIKLENFEIKDVNLKRSIVFKSIKEKLYRELTATKNFGNNRVLSVDCCCIIINSDLVLKNKLLFDENLSFHCYAEDLCFNAFYNLGIETKVVGIESYHLSLGNKDNEDFKKSRSYLKNKYKGKKIIGTCF